MSLSEEYMKSIFGDKYTPIEKDYIIKYKNKKYSIDSKWVDRLKSVDTEINEDYIEYLLQHINPHTENITSIGIESLIRDDYLNKKLFKSDILGVICQYDYEGNLLNEYTSLTDIMTIVSPEKYLYSFKCSNENFIIPQKNSVIHFGTQFTPIYEQKSWRYTHITSLNNWIQGFAKWCGTNHCSKIYEKPEYEYIKEKYSFEEFCNQRKLCHLFSLGGSINFAISQRNKIKARIDSLSEEEYNNKLNCLLHRYTYKNVSLFQKVENLNDFVSQKGIYILCLPEIKGYYVGKATKSLKKRIIDHWTKPNSDFDRTYGPNDVKKIYILNCSESYDAEYFIDAIERDCIATIGRKFSLNVMVGGNTIETIYDKDYDEKKYQISNKGMKSLQPILFSAYEKQKQKKKTLNDYLDVKGNRATIYEQYLNAVKYDYKSLFYIPVEMRNDELCLQAIIYHFDGSSHSFMDNSQKYVREFLNLIPLTSYSEKFVRQLIIELTGEHLTKILFEFLPLDSISFENLIFTVDCDIDSLDYIPSKYRTQDFYNQISKLNGKLFSKIPAEFLTKEVYINLVGALPVNIKKVPESYLDREFYVSAIKQNPSVLKYIPNSVIDNDIIETSLSIDSSVIRFVDSKNPDYPKYAFDSVKDDWKNLKYIPCEFRTKEMQNVVSSFGKRALKYFCEVSK